MRQVILLSNNNNLQYKINALFNGEDYQLEAVYLPIEEALVKLYGKQVDVVIITQSLIQGRSQILDRLVASKRYFVVFICKTLEYGLLYNVLNEPNFILMREDNLVGLTDILNYAFKIKDKLYGMERKVQQLETKIQDDKDVNQAKLLLMKEKQMSEADAHKFIIDNAMKLRLTKGQVARMIKERVIL